MANTDRPTGLRAIRHLGGGVYNGGGNLYSVASTSAALAPGDPVIVTGTADPTGIPEVTKASFGASNRITGAVIGRTNGEGTVLQEDNLNTTASIAGQYILVEDNPNVVFEAQVSASIAVTNISGTANLVDGTAIAGRSGVEVDSTSFGTAATGQVKILRLVRSPNNTVDTNAKVEVLINQHTLDLGTAGV